MNISPKSHLLVRSLSSNRHPTWKDLSLHTRLILGCCIPIWKAFLQKQILQYLLYWCPHLAGSSSCSSGWLSSYRPVETWRPFYRGVSTSVKQHVGVAGNHLTLLHHCDGTVIKQTPACQMNRGQQQRWTKGRQERDDYFFNDKIRLRCQLSSLAPNWPTSLRWLFLSLGSRA